MQEEREVVVAVGYHSGMSARDRYTRVQGKKTMPYTHFRSALAEFVGTVEAEKFPFQENDRYFYEFHSGEKSRRPDIHNLPKEFYRQLVGDVDNFMTMNCTSQTPRCCIFVKDEIVAAHVEFAHDSQKPLEYVDNPEWWFGRKRGKKVHWMDQVLGTVDDDGNITRNGLRFPTFIGPWPLPAMQDLTSAMKAFGEVHLLLTPEDDNPLSGLLRSGEPYRTLARQVIKRLEVIHQELQD